MARIAKPSVQKTLVGNGSLRKLHRGPQHMTKNEKDVLLKRSFLARNELVASVRRPSDVIFAGGAVSRYEILYLRFFPPPRPSLNRKECKGQIVGWLLGDIVRSFSCLSEIEECCLRPNR